MDIKQQEEYFDKFTSHMRGVMLKKGNDYAGGDRLSNFKKAGEVCGLTAELNCLSLIATKVARMGNLLTSNGEPNNESLMDTCLDGANYFILLAMILEDNKKTK